MTTNRNRWKVKKSKWLANPPAGASSIYTGSWHVESNDGEYAAFATHAEALAYADKMARTVEVMLPRPTEKFLATYRSYVAEWLPLGDEPENPVVWTFIGDGCVHLHRVGSGDLTPGETRKVALALLAAANCAEQENGE